MKNQTIEFSMHKNGKHKLKKDGYEIDVRKLSEVAQLHELEEYLEKCY